VITAALVALVATVGTFFVSLLPNPGPASASGVSNIQSGIASVMSKAASLGVWLPFGAAGSALLVIVACFGVTVGIHFVRMILSLFTGGGGNAA
jgi:hypothetical protein